jgi:hypothetical protein
VARGRPVRVTPVRRTYDRSLRSLDPHDIGHLGDAVTAHRRKLSLSCSDGLAGSLSQAPATTGVDWRLGSAGSRAEEKMSYNFARLEVSTERNDAARAVVEAAEARMCEMVEMLCGCPQETLGEAAREDLTALRPLLEEALEALEHVKSRRSLTENELAQQRAFKTLLALKE